MSVVSIRHSLTHKDQQPRSSANLNVYVRTSKFCSVGANKLELTISSFRDTTPTLGQFQRRLKTSLFRLPHGRDVTA